jgi:predicted dehydrogenase
MAQYGTRHGHAAGKLAAMLANPRVEMAGVYEPDAVRTRELSQGAAPYGEVRWFSDPGAMLNDPTILAVASEGASVESLDQTEAIVTSGKHVWYDKPAGEDWPRWRHVVAQARKKKLIIQMGYMFRYHEGFCRIAEWARGGMLGDLFSVRAHMSTSITAETARAMGGQKGGIWYDLAGHMLDQIVWLLGRPTRTSSFLRCDANMVPGFADNTLVVLEYDHAMAMVDIAAMESKPMARRFEVYGSRGSAILLEPFEPAHHIRLCLTDGRGEYRTGEQLIPIAAQSRQSLYESELEAFLGAITGKQSPDRSYDHDLLVQETLLRGTGALTA